MKVILFDIIKSKSNIYIKLFDVYNENIDKYIFDGKSGEPTLKNLWYKIDKVPKDVKVKNIEVIKNCYKLKDLDLSNKYPIELNYNDLFDEDGEWYGYDKLYNKEYETKEVIEDIEFKLNIYNIDDEFEFVHSRMDLSFMWCSSR